MWILGTVLVAVLIWPSDVRPTPVRGFRAWRHERTHRKDLF